MATRRRRIVAARDSRARIDTGRVQYGTGVPGAPTGGPGGTHVYDVELRRPNGSIGRVSIVAKTPSEAKRRAKATNPRLGIISVKRRS